MRVVVLGTTALCALIFSGCVERQPEVVLEPATAVAPAAAAQAATTTVMPVEPVMEQPKPSVKGDGPFLTDALRDYYSAARSAGNGGDRKPFDDASKTLGEMIEGKKADVNQPDTQGVVPLMIAVQANDAAMTARLIGAGATADVLTPQRLPLLSLALQEGTLESAKALLENGAKPNVGGESAPSPLTIATLGGITSRAYRDMALMLLDKGADANYGAVGEHTLLIYAIKTGQNDLALKLVQNGADVEMGDEEGMTPLSWAILLGQNDVVEALLAKNARGDARDAHGYNPVAWAVFAGNETAVQALAQRGFEAKESDRGWMAAEIAKSRTLNELRALLAGGAVAQSAAGVQPTSYAGIGAPTIVRFKGMDFFHLEYKGKELNFKTRDAVIKDFMLTRPDRLVVDFQRGAGAQNLVVPLQDATFQKVSIGRHAGWYRVVIQLDRAYEYTITQGSEGPVVRLR
ncbi:MAG: ankyrin repeat domain-containing protein [Campylobacterales bacterium]